MEDLIASASEWLPSCTLVSESRVVWTMDKEYGTIEVDTETVEGAVVITLARPSRRNAFNQAMYSDITDVLEWAASAPSIGVVVFTGSGSYFSSGADLKEMTSSVMASSSDRTPVRPQPQCSSPQWATPNTQSSTQKHTHTHRHTHTTH